MAKGWPDGIYLQYERDMAQTIHECAEQASLIRKDLKYHWEFLKMSKTNQSQNSASDSSGSTEQLCNWAINLQLSEVPEDVQHRAKLIILDGIGFGLIGAHLPWSEKAVRTILAIEPPGPCSLFGWKQRLSGSAAALLNSTFIQGFQLDDWHVDAPLHSASLLLPALLAAAEQTKISDDRTVSGESFLLAMIVGLEAGPRIGLGLGGAHMLSRGWHSGAVFGGPAVAVAVSKLLGLSPQQMEWALGHACTQAGGLMSAQFGSMAKRMQHGSAARNGLLAAHLARADYTGIERVLDLSYGGFFSTFNASSKQAPTIEKGSVFDNLGTDWEIKNVAIKPYPLLAFLHASVDCVKLLQEKHGAKILTIEEIKKIKIESGEVAYKHGGWKVEAESLDVTGAQISAAYAVAVQLLDGELVPRSFTPDKLNRSALFDLIKRTDCVHQKDFDGSLNMRITMGFSDGTEVVEMVENPRGVQPRLSDEDILEK